MTLALDEELRARRELYELLARLYLGPPDAELLERLRALPGLAEHVPASADALEALQVEHELIFGRNVYPYESLYVDRDLMLNTAAAERVAVLYEACGFVSDLRAAGAPDHLGLELGLMGYLLALEGAAHAAQDGAGAAWARAQQGRGLHEHLARWAPSCVGAVLRVATHPLYRMVGELTLELVLSDVARVGAPGPAAIVLEQRRAGGAPPEDAEEPGVGRVVRRLLTPDEAGMFLSRADLSQIGRGLGLPAPIGERFQMLRGLFEGAGRFELVVPLLDALDGVLAEEDGRLAALVGRHPAWADGARHWRSRLAHGRALLAELRAEARAGEDETGGTSAPA